MNAVPLSLVKPPELQVPCALRPLRGWLVWRLVADADPTKKPRKVPFYAGSGSKRSGEQGGVRDRAQLVDFDTAMAARKRGGFTGVGFALLPEFDLVALDFDDCVTDGKVDSAVENLVSSTYAELSPSGKGVRAFMRGSSANNKSRATEKQWGFETFHSSGFVTITGNPLDVCRMFGTEDTIAPLTQSVRELCALRFGTRQEPVAPADDLGRTLALKRVDDETLTDLRQAVLHGLSAERVEGYDSWIDTGAALKSLEQAGHGVEARELWHAFTARSDRYDVEQADAKWDGFSPRRITYLSIFRWAQDDGWVNPRSVQALKTGDADAYALLEDRTDTGNANMLVRLTAGDLRYVPERRLWLWWDGARWLADEFGAHAYAAAQRVAQHYHGKADELKRQAADEALNKDERKRITTAGDGLEKQAAHCRNKRALDAMLALAALDSRIVVAAADLDSDPWLLGVANGVVDLRTGQLRGAGRDELVTKRSPAAFDPNAKAPRWRQFVAEITGSPLPVEFDTASGRPMAGTVGRYTPRPALAGYLQRALGYTLTGSTAEQKMLIAIGAGSNGKNVLLDIAQEIIGDYCRTIPPEALMATRHDADAERPSPTAASLAGARLAISSESRDGQKLDVALVKRHTGGGFMTARLMRENSFRFAITHKLVLMTNHRPALDHLDDAMRGRLHLIPFDRVWNRPGHSGRDDTLPDGDKDLMDRLRAEAQGVLAWLIEGAVLYARDGLEPPPEVVRMTRAYFAEQDPIGRWIETMARCAPEAGTPARELFEAFTRWHQNDDTGGGHGPGSEKAFGEALRARNVPKKATKTANRYGLRIQKVEGGR